jgi:hypothetical protein
VKSSIFTLVAVVSIVGATATHILGRHSESGKPHPLATNFASHPTTDRQAEMRPNPVARLASAESPKASLEPQQAPVPLLLKPRESAKPSTTESTATPATGDAGTMGSSGGPGPAGENAARAAIEADGYKSVRIVSRGDGVWRAKALRGKTEVLLIVDANGSVTTAN